MADVPASLLQLFQNVNAAIPQHATAVHLEKLSSELAAPHSGFKGPTADKARVQKLMRVFFPITGDGAALSCTCPGATKKCPILFFKAFFAVKGPEALIKRLGESCIHMTAESDSEMEAWIVMIVHQSVVVSESKVVETCVSPLTKQVTKLTDPHSLVPIVTKILMQTPQLTSHFCISLGRLVFGEVSLPDSSLAQRMETYSGELMKQFNAKALVVAKGVFEEFDHRRTPLGDIEGARNSRSESSKSRKSNARPSLSTRLKDMTPEQLKDARQKAAFDFAMALSKSANLGHRGHAIQLLEGLAEQNYRKAECLLWCGLIHFASDRAPVARPALQQALSVPDDSEAVKELRAQATRVLKWTEPAAAAEAEEGEFGKLHSWITFPDYCPSLFNALHAGPVKAGVSVLEQLLKILNKEQLNNTRMLSAQDWQYGLFACMRFPTLRDQSTHFQAEKTKGLKPAQERAASLAVSIFSRLAFTYFTLFEATKPVKPVKAGKKGEQKESKERVDSDDEGVHTQTFAARKPITQYLLESFDMLENTIGFTDSTTRILRDIISSLFKHVGGHTYTLKTDSFTSSGWIALFDLLQVAENFVFYSGLHESISLAPANSKPAEKRTRFNIPPRDAPRAPNERHFHTVGIHFDSKGQCLDLELINLILILLEGLEFKTMAPTSGMSSEELAALKKVKTRGVAEIEFFRAAHSYLQCLSETNAAGAAPIPNSSFMAMMEARQKERLNSETLAFLKQNAAPAHKKKGLKKLLGASSKGSKGEQLKRFKSSFVSAQNAQLYFRAKALVDENEEDYWGDRARPSAPAPTKSVAQLKGAAKPAKSSYFSDMAKQEAQSREQAAAIEKSRAEALAKFKAEAERKAAFDKYQQQQREAEAFIAGIKAETVTPPTAQEAEAKKAQEEAKLKALEELEAKEREAQEASKIEALQAMKQTHTVLETYEAEEEVELSIQPGDRLHIGQTVDGWSQATNLDTGAMGWVPCDFIEEVPAVQESDPERSSGLSVSVQPELSPEEQARRQAEAERAAARAAKAEQARQEAAAGVVARCGVCHKGLKFDEVYERGGAAAGIPYCEEDFRKTFFSCGTCRRVVEEEEPSVTIPNHDPQDGQEVDEDDVTFYHMACLECSVCHAKNDNPAEMEGKEGKLYCQNDWATIRGFPCAWCNGLIKGEPLEALGLKFHQDHFLCYGKCGKNLVEHKFAIPTEAQRRYYAAKQCMAGDQARMMLLNSFKVDADGASITEAIEKLTTEQKIETKEEAFCNECFISRYKVVCPACGLEIMEWETGVYVGDNKLPFHTRCYHCVVCAGQKKTLAASADPTEVTEASLLLGERNQLYCETHFYAKFMTKACCQVCKKPLKDPANPHRASLNVQEFEYHIDCMRCKHCNVRLSDPGQQTYIHSLLPAVKEAEFYCGPHYQQLIVDAGSPDCRHCGLKITTGGFSIKGNQYHTDCRKCKKCNIPLSIGSSGADKLVFVLKKLPNGETVGDMYCPKDKP